jgi:hypothetical protein
MTPAAIVARLVHGAAQHFELALDARTDHAVPEIHRLRQPFADMCPQFAITHRRVGGHTQLVDQMRPLAVKLGQLKKAFLGCDIRHLACHGQGTAVETHMNGMIVDFQV